MTPTTTTLPKPTSKSLLRGPSMLNQAKPISFLRFPASKSDFFGLKNKALSKTMTELVRISVFRASYGGNSEESTGSFQQGDVIHGPNKFQSVLLAGGLEATLNCLSKWLVVTFFGAVILGRHDAKAMWAALGLVVNSILSVILKRTFNQERPDSTLRSDPGMPSSHGQSIFFTLVFAILSVGEWLGVNEFTLILSAFMLAFGTYLIHYFLNIIFQLPWVTCSGLSRSTQF
uniref:Phosphatidic acid phosphatase type 2/haloperoxidase domain-containing protein n=1 Tax=Populus trichocarpa TaxID=3694 RepID=A0A3N7F1N8_POPTR|eukprot:XP_024456987.1 lipid phosphate phosphatase epsilon 1, chloroplastic isoform X2 [Populus trichocarpa]